MDTEVADRKQLRRRVVRWTAVMWTLIAVTGADLAIYLPDARAGHAVLRPHENVILFMLAGVLIVLAYMARREAKGEQLYDNGERRQAQREAARMAELVVIESALKALFDLSERAEETREHRDGRLYGLVKFAHSAAIGAITERDLERDTEQLPRVVSGGYRATGRIDREAIEMGQAITRRLSLVETQD